MKIAFLGDTHYELAGLRHYTQRVMATHKPEAFIHVGDLGITPTGLRILFAQRIRFPRPVYVVDGNHDDYALWYDQRLVDRLARHHNVCLVKRSTVLEFSGTRVLCCGGALSVHNEQRQGPFTNVIQSEDIERCLSAVDEKGPVDLVVTHSCPSDLGLLMPTSGTMRDDATRYITSAGHDGGSAGDPGEPLLTQLFHSLRHRRRAPSHWVYGHWHLPWEKTIDDVQFRCVPQPMDYPDAVVQYQLQEEGVSDESRLSGSVDPTRPCLSP